MNTPTPLNHRLPLGPIGIQLLASRPIRGEGR